MHIDHDQPTLETESDVEQKVVMPLLKGPNYLAIPENRIFTKQYLAPTALDKMAGKLGGYYPDYSVWLHSFPVMIVEVKAPGVAVEVGYREASLYARHLNQNYPTTLNPCRFLLSLNDAVLLFGYWDADPLLAIAVSDLKPGTTALAELLTLCGSGVLDDHARVCLHRVTTRRAVRPFNLAGGPAILNAKKPLNSFAADLSPILRRYFSSAYQENNREIAERAYVSSAEATEYDRVLESLLKDRLSVHRDTIVQPLEPGRHGEAKVARAIADFGTMRPKEGQLQIVQGAVGSGKSLFIRRYKEVLQPTSHAGKTQWAFIDFNTGPADLSQAEIWLCSTFVDSFRKENPSFDISSNDVLRGIFSRNLQRRKGIYDEIAVTSKEQAALTRANDLARWQDDPTELAAGLADYVLGSRNEILVVVMDNVDRLDLKNQLHSFQLALWFMERTHCFVILQMRDETYERFKNKKPLDTFRTGITFHISPPRFIDVVKKRLELSLEYLAHHADETQVYTLDNGARISFPKSDLGVFLRELYIEIFENRRNISRVLEALAGRDVRRALEMFVSIITSGHLSELAITSRVKGAGAIPITEHVILKILMRTDYRYFSDRSGFVTNVFSFVNDWEKPDNFILIEILFLLATNRKKVGQIGLEGYFTCRYVADNLQRQGYVVEDVMAGLNLLLVNQLIAADHMNFVKVELDDCVRIQASGFIHVRVLAERLEYIYGIIPTTPILDQDTAKLLADYVNRENQRGDATHDEKIRAVEIFLRYLQYQKQTQKDRNPFVGEDQTGAAYVIHRITTIIGEYRNARFRPQDGTLLDA